MRLELTGEQLDLDIRAYGFVGKDAWTKRTRKNKETGVDEVRTAPDGEAIFGLPAGVIDAFTKDANGLVRRDGDVSITVCVPVDLDPSKTYRPSGTVWVSHYVGSGSGDYRPLKVSVIAETLVPADA